MSALDHTASPLHLHHSPCTFLVFFLVFCTRFSSQDMDKVLSSQSSKPRPQGLASRACKRSIYQQVRNHGEGPIRAFSWLKALLH